MFAGDPIILAMAVTLDMAKLVTVSFLYRNWKKLNALMKTYMLTAAIILMTITSSGTAGYLSNAFEKAVMPQKQNNVVLVSMQAEKSKLEARRADINKQISNLPPDYARARARLINSFKPETDSIDKRLSEIDQQLPQLQTKDLHDQTSVGPIAFIAKTFNLPMEKAVSVVIGLIIFVFDPLAVVLIISGNYLVMLRKGEHEEVEQKILPNSKDVVKSIVESNDESKYDLASPEYIEEPFNYHEEMEQETLIEEGHGVSLLNDPHLDKIKIDMMMDELGTNPSTVAGLYKGENYPVSK